MITQALLYMINLASFTSHPLAHAHIPQNSSTAWARSSTPQPSTAKGLYVSSCAELHGNLRESVSHAIFSHIVEDVSAHQGGVGATSATSADVPTSNILFDERHAEPSTTPSAPFVDELVSAAEPTAGSNAGALCTSAHPLNRGSIAEPGPFELKVEALAPSACPNPKEAGKPAAGVTSQNSWSSSLSTASCHSRSTSASEDSSVQIEALAPAAANTICSEPGEVDVYHSSDAPLCAEAIGHFLAHAMNSLQLEPECLVIGLILLERVRQQQPCLASHGVDALASPATDARPQILVATLALPSVHLQVLHQPEPKLSLTPYTWRLATLVALLIASKIW